MQRSSSSIASLAAALAKAQAELVNPEKSLVATIRSDRGAERTFRYAPLSSGLDIVRKILGQHEIATVQTTAIDQAAGIVNLTTLLAHASGEWISSDWPVCAIADTATPRRMGAALTYARRYSLFTLVGIAGEDDLDAPDLATPTAQTSDPEKPMGSENCHLNGVGPHDLSQPAPSRRDGKLLSNSAAPMLGADASAKLRDRLLAELQGISNGDAAAIWAHRCLPEKNRLKTADALIVETRFQETLASFADCAPVAPEPTATSEQSVTSPNPGRNKREQRQRSGAIDKSTLALAEPRRVRDRDHVRYVAGQPCLVCGRQPCDAHHLRFTQNRALGRKVSDEFTVPLCRGHHREVHRHGDEGAWWGKSGIDPVPVARALWLETHPLVTAQDNGLVETTAGDSVSLSSLSPRNFSPNP